MIRYYVWKITYLNIPWWAHWSRSHSENVQDLSENISISVQLSGTSRRTTTVDCCTHVHVRTYKRNRDAFAIIMLVTGSRSCRHPQLGTPTIETFWQCLLCSQRSAKKYETPASHPATQWTTSHLANRKRLRKCGCWTRIPHAPKIHKHKQTHTLMILPQNKLPRFKFDQHWQDKWPVTLAHNNMPAS